MVAKPPCHRSGPCQFDESPAAQYTRIGPDNANRGNSILNESLALLLWFAPPVRPGRVTSGAVAREQLLSRCGLLPVDLAEDFLGPFRRSKAPQKLLADQLT